MITLSDVAKLDLRIGTILEAAPIEGADNLLQLTVDTGEDPATVEQKSQPDSGAERTLVAGIAQHYTPDQLIGRQIVVVANLEPKELMGVESQGMLLAASDDDAVALLQPDQSIANGSPVS